jgi:signal transduction histidine kinase
MATFAVVGARRPYSSEDVALIEEVAARLSIALENRELYASLKATADELSRANASKDEFLALVSHELKTPLTTIRGNAGVLAKETTATLDPDARAAALADIVAESDRLHRIIENLLLLARAEQGQPLDAEPLLLVRIAQRVIERHRRTAPTRTIELIEESAPRTVMFSEACLELVLENLLSNAEKYSSPDAPIVVDIKRDEESVTLRVLDEGPGIESDEAEAIFNPFFRSESTHRRAAGLGIGLTVCKRLVETQGGVMWGLNRDPHGAEFGFRIPILNANES